MPLQKVQVLCFHEHSLKYMYIYIYIYIYILFIYFILGEIKKQREGYNSNGDSSVSL